MTRPLAPPPRNSRIARRIEELLPLLSTEEQRKFRRRFRTESPEQANHTFRELLLGVYLLGSGFAVRYDHSLGGKTPDWVLFDADGVHRGLVDQTTFHQTRELDDEIIQTLRRGEAWVGWLPDNATRLYQKLHAKAEVYAELSRELSIPNVVAVFFEFNADVEEDEVHEVLFKLHGGGLFKHAPSLSGVISFREQSGTYSFRYALNPEAQCRLILPDGRV